MNVGFGLISVVAAMIASLPILAAPLPRTSTYDIGDENTTISPDTINTNGSNHTTSLADDDGGPVEIDTLQNINKTFVAGNYSINTHAEDAVSVETSKLFGKDGNITQLDVDNRTNDEVIDNLTKTHYTDNMKGMSLVYILVFIFGNISCIS